MKTKVIMFITILNIASSSFFSFPNYNLNNEIYTWNKYSSNQIIGNKETGSLFDPFIIQSNNGYSLIVSSRKSGSIVSFKSSDGINFDDNYTTLLEPNSDEYVYNRCSILRRNNKYYMYFTKQYKKNASFVKSEIFLATSKDGLKYDIVSDEPVITFSEPYEKESVMNPSVIYDDLKKEYKMYYAAGEIYEPDVICMATSKDGLKWKKYKNNPILEKNNDKESLDNYKVGGPEVHMVDGKYYMYYIGYSDIDTGRIFQITSDDGINWNRNTQSLIVAPMENDFDTDSVYKPSLVYLEKENKTMLYYNGRTGENEYIGLYTKKGNINY